MPHHVEWTDAITISSIRWPPIEKGRCMSCERSNTLRNKDRSYIHNLLLQPSSSGNEFSPTRADVHQKQTDHAEARRKIEKAPRRIAPNLTVF